jgi:adenosine deaminase
MIDLHLHLDGSLSPEEIGKLAAMNHVAFDSQKVRLSVDSSCTSLNDYLECFAFPLTLLQTEESLSYAAYALYTRIAHQGLIYAEVRFAPELSLAKGLSQDQVVAAVIKGYQKAHQETGIIGNFILCCMRGKDNHDLNLETVKVAKRFLGKGVVAIDLAGAEALFKTNTFNQEFELAKALGVPFTIHAGEADGPSSVWDALHFGASRIGHGVHAIEDPKLVAYLAEHQIPLEICPTSEVDTHCVPSIKALPIREFIKAGVPITINTDDMTVSNVTLEGEFDKVIAAFDLSDEQVKTLWFNAVNAAYLDEKGKALLKKKLEERL